MDNLSNQIQTVLEQSAAPLVITWKSKKTKGALITKIGKQRYLGLVRKDKKGQEYWKYHLLTKFSESVAMPTPPKKEEGEIEQVEQSPDAFLSQEELEQSPEVKKFREKYGNFPGARIKNHND